MRRLREGLIAWMPALAAGLLVLLVVGVAHAANFEAESEALVNKGARWFQRLAMTGIVIAIMEAGTRFFSEDKSQGARAHMRNVLIGSVLVLGSVGLAELLKSSFSGSRVVPLTFSNEGGDAPGAEAGIPPLEVGLQLLAPLFAGLLLWSRSLRAGRAIRAARRGMRERAAGN